MCYFYHAKTYHKKIAKIFKFFPKIITRKTTFYPFCSRFSVRHFPNRFLAFPGVRTVRRYVTIRTESFRTFGACEWTCHVNVRRNVQLYVDGTCHQSTSTSPLLSSQSWKSNLWEHPDSGSATELMDGWMSTRQTREKGRSTCVCLSVMIRRDLT